MHFKVLFLILSVCFYGSVMSLVNRTETVPRSSKPAHLGACYVDRYKTTVKFEQWYKVPGECAIMTCNQYRQLTIESCDKPIPGRRCRVIRGPENRHKDYPNCCPIVKCS